jgi:hypothetical protein
MSLAGRLKDAKEGGGGSVWFMFCMEFCFSLRNNPEEIGVPCMKEYASISMGGGFFSNGVCLK